MKRMCLVLLFVLVATEAKKDSKLDLLNLNSNHVNLSLETAFVFDPKDTYYDVSLLRTLRSFIDSLQNAITSKAKLRTLPKDNYGLSDFLYELGVNIIKYTDAQIKSAAVALQSVVEDYYPAGTIYHKIFFDPRLKAFIKNTLKEWAASDPKILRAGLKAMYDGPTYDEVFVSLVQALNSLFDTEDSPTLMKYAKKFAAFPSTTSKLESNIDKALNFIVFDRYEMLNFSMRSFVVEELSKISEYAIFAFKNRSVDPEFFLLRKHTDNKNLTLQDMIARKKIDGNSNEFSGSEREDFPVNPNDSLERITKTSIEDKDEDNNNIEHEIVLNKNIEINVKQKDIEEKAPDNVKDNNFKAKEDKSVQKDEDNSKYVDVDEIINKRESSNNITSER